MISMKYRKINEGNTEWDLHFLADQMAEGPASDYYHAACAELCRRQATSQREAAMAQVRSSKYMFWMATAIMVSVVLDTVFGFLEWRFPHLS